MPRRRTPPFYGVNIRRLIDASGRSITEIASDSGMGVQQLVNIMNNAALNPTVNTLQRIAVALHVDLATLVASSTADAASQEASNGTERTSQIDQRIIRTELVELFKALLHGALYRLESASEQPVEQGQTAPHQAPDESPTSPVDRRAVRE